MCFCFVIHFLFDIFPTIIIMDVMHEDIIIHFEAQIDGKCLHCTAKEDKNQRRYDVRCDEVANSSKVQVYSSQHRT